MTLIYFEQAEKETTAIHCRCPPARPSAYLPRKLGGEVAGVEAGDELHTTHTVQQLQGRAGRGASAIS